jgi:integrase/recombinase XerD
MATYRIILRQTQDKNINGEYSVSLRVTHKRKVKIYHLDLRSKPEDWSKDFDRFKKTAKNFRDNNLRLEEIEKRAHNTIQQIQTKYQAFNFSEFSKKFFEKDEQISIAELLENRISKYEAYEQYSTAANYRSTYHVLMDHLNGTFRYTPEILRKEHIESFVSYLRKRGNNDGSIHHHLRNIRATINEAIANNQLPIEAYPFQNQYNRNGFPISSIKPSPLPRALSEKDMDKLKDFRYEEYPDLAEAYLYFMFSYFARGMNFGDMARLKKTGLAGNRITYTRNKTQETFSIPISNDLRRILAEFDTQSDYVFPILNELHKTEQQFQNRKRKVLSRVNRNLKKVGRILQIDTPLTTYVARHTYATTLDRKDAHPRKISKALGHADLKTTEAYLAKFRDKEVDELDKLL